MSIPLVSIVIVSWNTRELLGQCLGTVAAEVASNFAPGEVETFVVDNASTDGSVEAVRRQYPWVMLIENEGNPGFAAANNQAIAQSKGKFIFLLNPDTALRSGALAALVRFLDEHASAGAVGSRLLNPDGTLQVSCYPRLTLPHEFWRLFHLDRLSPRAIYRMEGWSLERPRAVDVLQGAALLVRRTVLDQVGALDPAYFMYTEEVDLCYRIQRAGWQLYWMPTSQVVHYGGQSTRQVATAMFLQLYRSKVQYFRKNHGKAAAQCYKVILGAAATARLALSPIAWLARPAQHNQTATVATHYRHLLFALPTL